MDMRGITQPISTISNVSGTAAAGGGVITFLNENAGAIGVLFTGLTFLVFFAGKVFEGVLAYKEHKKRSGE